MPSICTYEENYERFTASRQEKIRLEAALRGYFMTPEPTDVDKKAEYAAYLKRRIRPALRSLMEQGSLRKIEVLFQDGLAGGRSMEDLLGEISDRGRMDLWLELYAGGSLKTGRRDSDRQRYLTREILRRCRLELCGLLPGLQAVLSLLRFQVTDECTAIGIEEDRVIVNPDFAVRWYAKDPMRMNRLLLHLCLHGLMGHLNRRPSDLEADLAVEQWIEGLCAKREDCRKRLGSLQEDAEWQICKKWLDDAKERHARREELQDSPAWNARRDELQDKPPGSIRWEELLDDAATCFRLQTMKARWFPDEHRGWSAQELDKEAQDMERFWAQLSAMTRLSGLEGGGIGKGGAGSEAGGDSDQLGRIRPSRRDYSTFLRRFAVRKEEMEIDPESFDYVYYTLGLERYQIPLIEPLEYREGHKLEELVIAIDTSWSCSTELVRQFLEETYAILSDRENFFDRMKVYILQCDCCVQEAVCIASREAWERYCQNLTIRGRAGTDFRPVFQYVEKLRREKKLTDLKALLYFSDGKGIYPREAPDYETAFVFLKQEAGREQLPAWAIGLELDSAAFLK
ncbi:MAG: VWA-like domain-containing protein [Lachnospiraceae bacterium]|nr:VWA-like domain-containing protein [Lachnospiraceae bacterium]